MFEPYSEEEEKYIRYLIKKYLPGLGCEDGKTGPSVMFEQNDEVKIND
jgi:hypothetical protein